MSTADYCGISDSNIEKIFICFCCTDASGATKSRAVWSSVILKQAVLEFRISWDFSLKQQYYFVLFVNFQFRSDERGLRARSQGGRGNLCDSLLY